MLLVELIDYRLYCARIIRSVTKCKAYRTVLCGEHLWAYQSGVTLDFSRLGRPKDNAFIEAFNGRFREACLNAHWFLILADTAEKLEDWRTYYSEDRPHSAIGNKPPITLMKLGDAASPSS